MTEARDGRRVRARTAGLIAMTIAFNAAGNLFLSLGMKEVGTIRRPWSLVNLAMAWRTTVLNSDIWVGVGLLVVFLASYLLLLSWADYSYVHPASAAGYVLIPLLACTVGGEQVSALRWVGVALISAGVLVVGKTPVSTTGSEVTR